MTCQSKIDQKSNRRFFFFCKAEKKDVRNGSTFCVAKEDYSIISRKRKKRRAQGHIFCFSSVENATAQHTRIYTFLQLLAGQSKIDREAIKGFFTTEDWKKPWIASLGTAGGGHNCWISLFLFSNQKNTEKSCDGRSSERKLFALFPGQRFRDHFFFWSFFDSKREAGKANK